MILPRASCRSDSPRWTDDRGFPKTFYLLEELTVELRLTEKTAYEKLIRMMSHEVNDSVGAVRSLLESVLHYAEQIGPDDRADFTSALTIAAARIESLNRFMTGFADVVRLPPPHPRDVDLGPIVDDIGRLLRPELENHAIVLKTGIPAGARVLVDQSQFEARHRCLDNRRDVHAVLRHEARRPRPRSDHRLRDPDQPSPAVLVDESRGGRRGVSGCV